MTESLYQWHEKGDCMVWLFGLTQPSTPWSMMRTKHPRFKRSNNWNGSILVWNLWPHFDTSIGCSWNWPSRFSNSLEANYFASTWRWWSGPGGGWGWPDSSFSVFHFLWGCWLAPWHGAECSQPPAVFSFAWGASKWQIILWKILFFSSYLTLPLKNTLCLATVGWPSVPWSRPCWTRRRRTWRISRSSHPNLFEFVEKSE